ncbi:hypothetical protein RRG08_012440 [Elysia crispata]|uniref:Uncharacterized protein n=1 Tax=Elysia crispata TaxID=231223 RepID=A0AAE0XR71_9GAST|nr:hypothetical protein RRG08_012440 [Elysia crispata]
MIKSLTPEGICQRCKDIIDWKIKYKKYKPLTQPSTCVRCHNKTVKRAYYTVCQPCATAAEVCAKCNVKQTVVIEPSPSEQEKNQQDKERHFELRQLKERERRTFLRHSQKGDTSTVMPSGAEKVFDEDEEEHIDDDGDDNDDMNQFLEHHNIDGSYGEENCCSGTLRLTQSKCNCSWMIQDTSHFLN